jgi:acetylornithine deacetylase/succinyl-diaminopimelate desuccinylase-like protein
VELLDLSGELIATMTVAERITSFIDDEFARETAFLAALVRMPSDNPPGDCATHAARTRVLLDGLGLKAEAHPVPPEQALAAGMVSATNLIVRHRFGPGPTTALNAHGDVVPPGLGWTRDPYGAAIEGGPHGDTMFGRGVAVSKSDFATYAFALLALKAAAADGATFGGTVELHLTYDEEAGGEIGPKWLLERGLSKPDYVIGAGFSYAIVNAHNGCLHLEVTVTGKQAHAAMPETGRDALAVANSILTLLYQSRPALAQIKSKVPGINSPTLNVGLISGGINTNVVPDRVTFRLDRRIIPEEAPPAVEMGLRAQISAVALPEGINVEVRRLMLAEPLAPCTGWERIATAIADRARDVLGAEVPVNGVPLYTDARHYAARGIPVVLYGAGPRTLLEANAHNANENLRLSDLRAATKIVALAVADLLG